MERADSQFSESIEHERTTSLNLCINNMANQSLHTLTVCLQFHMSFWLILGERHIEVSTMWHECPEDQGLQQGSTMAIPGLPHCVGCQLACNLEYCKAVL